MSKKNDKKVNDVPLVARPSGSEMIIPMGMIVADDEFNARKNLDDDNTGDGGHDFKSLVHSIKMDGQLSPVMVAVVREYPNKYFLVSGFRRFYAMSRTKEEGGLGLESIKATIYQTEDDSPVDLKELKYLNLIENEARKNLNPYERALRYHDLVSNHEDKGAQIAKRVSLDPSYVNRLVAAMDMDPKVIERFKLEWSPEFSGKERWLTTDQINKLTHMRLENGKQDHAAQRAWLEGKIAPVTDTGDDEGDDDDKDSPELVKRTSMAQIKKAIAAADLAFKEAKNVKEQERIEAIREGLKFAIKPRKLDGVCTVHDEGKVIKNVKGEAVAATKS
jgi:ParB/RepB/Spo0J family partition protein